MAYIKLIEAKLLVLWSQTKCIICYVYVAAVHYNIPDVSEQEYEKEKKMLFMKMQNRNLLVFQNNIFKLKVIVEKKENMP